MNTQQTLCPPADRLAQLVSGSLIEAEAERLFAHIDRCSSCQFQVDELTRRKDPVIVAARQAEPASVDNDGLSKLIRMAARLPDSEDTRKATQGETKSISAAEFVDGLRRSGLMDQTELSQILSDLSWDGTDRSGDSGRLARALIQNHKLTLFQAKLLLRGRWKGLLLGNYAILDKLGQGGMGAVFKARHTRMGRIVCLKIVNSAGRQSPDVIDRFRNEARALAKLSHPNIVVAHDADEAKGVPYLVMEFIDGDDLAKRVRKVGPLSVPQALEVGIQTARALWYAHGQGVIHRDIKPHNLVATFDETGQTFVKVLDLGLARFDSLMTDNPDASVLAAMTNTGVVIGTVDYMAPEQALDSRNADARSDIYSLGCTLFFLLAARPPFSGDTVMQRLVAHREQPTPDLSVIVDGVTPELSSVIGRMLAKDPAERYQSMDMVLSDLQAVASGQAPSVPVSAPTTALGVHGTPVTSAASSASAASPLDIHTVEAASVGQTPSRYYKPLPLAMGIVVVVALVFGVSQYISSLSSPADPNETDVVQAGPPPRVGAQQTIRNGGDGRALVLVSSKQFRQEEFEALVSTLTDEGDVNVVVASSKYGTGEAEFGESLRSRFENINLADAKGDEYDAVIALDGDNWELSHKNAKNHADVKRIVADAKRNNVRLIGCNHGFHQVLKETGLLDKAYQPFTYDVCDTSKLAPTTREVFDKLLTERAGRRNWEAEPTSPSERRRGN